MRIHVFLCRYIIIIKQILCRTCTIKILYDNIYSRIFPLVSAFPGIPNDATSVHWCFYGARDEEHLDIRNKAMRTSIIQ